VFDLTFTIEARDGTMPLTLAIDQAVIAGWTGRDPVARDRHIAELEALGIARPATAPIYYRVSARRLTQEDSIEVCGDQSSGEVEFVLIAWQGRIFVGLGSDHTDRKVESYSVSVSKQMCDKPIAPVLWELEDVVEHWDRMHRLVPAVGGATQPPVQDRPQLRDQIGQGIGEIFVFTAAEAVAAHHDAAAEMRVIGIERGERATFVRAEQSLHDRAALRVKFAFDLRPVDRVDLRGDAGGGNRTKGCLCFCVHGRQSRRNTVTTPPDFRWI